MPKRITTLDGGIAAFIEGAKIYHVALSIDDNKMARRGLPRTRESLEYIDQHSPTRDILLPLLNDKDDGVRLSAAGALFQSWPDLVMPVIQDVSDNAVSEAYLHAGMIFGFKEVFGYLFAGHMARSTISASEAGCVSITATGQTAILRGESF